MLAPAAAAAAPPTDSTGPSEPYAVEPYIVGGRPAAKTYGFEASLQLTDGRAFCGGSLISSRWLLTSADCAPLIEPGKAVARFGSLDRTTGGTLAGVRQVIVHPDYVPGGLPARADLALVELDQTVPQRPILISPRSMRIGRIGQVRGWGTTCDKDLNDPTCRASSKTLQQLDITRLPDSRCAGPLLPRGTGVCFRAADGTTKQACYGDAGAGVFTIVRGRPLLAATVTGDGDAEPTEEFRPHECTTTPDGDPGTGVGQDVTKHVGWIADTVWHCDAQQGRELQAQFREASSVLAA